MTRVRYDGGVSAKDNKRLNHRVSAGWLLQVVDRWRSNEEPQWDDSSRSLPDPRFGLSFRGFNHVVFTAVHPPLRLTGPSLAVETAFPRPVVYRSLTRVIKTFRLSLSLRFVVRSLPLLSDLMMMTAHQGRSADPRPNE